jgi:hypothetical protein
MLNAREECDPLHRETARDEVRYKPTEEMTIAFIGT